MTYSFVAGNVLTAAQLNALAPVYVIKQSTQTIASSTVQANDAELVVALATGKTYLITCRLVVGSTSGAATGDIAVSWTRTGTLNQVGARHCTGPSIATTDVSGTATAAVTVGVLRRSGGHALTTAVNYGNDGTNTAAVEETFIIQAAASGNLQLQWAQNSSVANGTTVIAGSYLMAEVIAA